MVLTTTVETIKDEHKTITTQDIVNEINKKKDSKFIRTVTTSSPLNISTITNSDQSTAIDLNLNAELNHLNDVHLQNPPDNSFLNYDKDEQKWKSKLLTIDDRFGNMCQTGPCIMTCGASIGTHYDIFYGPSLGNNTGFNTNFLNGNPDNPYMKHFIPVDVGVSSPSNITTLDFNGFKLGYSYIFSRGVCICQDFNGTVQLPGFSYGDNSGKGVLYLPLPDNDVYKTDKQLSYCYVKTSDGSGASTRYNIIFEPYQLYENLTVNTIDNSPLPNKFSCYVEPNQNSQPYQFDIKFSELPNLNLTTQPYTCYNLIGAQSGAQFAVLRINNNSKVSNFQITDDGASFVLNQNVTFERSSQKISGYVSSLTQPIYTDSNNVQYGGISSFVVTASDYNIDIGTCFIALSDQDNGASSHMLINQVISPSRSLGSTTAITDMPSTYDEGKVLTSTKNGYVLTDILPTLEPKQYLNSYNYSYENNTDFIIYPDDATSNNPNSALISTLSNDKKYSFFIDGIETPVLDLIAGRTYNFKLADYSDSYNTFTGSSTFAFYEFESSTGGQYDTYKIYKPTGDFTPPVNNNGIYSLKITKDTPDILYYGMSYDTATISESSFHMGNKLLINGSRNLRGINLTGVPAQFTGNNTFEKLTLTSQDFDTLLMQNGGGIHFNYNDIKISSSSGVSNISIGNSSLQNNTTGERNIAIGTSTLFSNTGASANTAVGHYSMSSTTSGHHNTGFGANTLEKVNTGAWNTAIGFNSGASTTTGSLNTTVGWASLYENKTGSQNTVIGTWAQFKGTNLNSNTAVGFRALFFNSTGSNNTAIGTCCFRTVINPSDFNTGLGYNCSIADGLSYCIAIGASADVGQHGTSQTIQIGHDASFNCYIGTCQILTNGNKTFVIDHPFDKKEKYLVHSTLEGPEAGVYYRGKSEIVRNNEVKVELPYYFHSLVKEDSISIQLQRIGKYDQHKNQLSCEYKSNNHFYVYGDSGKFYWHVYAERKNAEFDVEPLKKNKKLHNFGPYTYLE